MSAEETKKWQAELEARMPDGEKGKSQSPEPVKVNPETKEKVKPIPEEPLVVPQLAIDKVPAEWRDYWVKCQSLLPQLDSAKHAILARAMIKFADAVKMGNPVKIEENGSLLQDALLEVWI